jgi:surface antigen
MLQTGRKALLYGLFITLLSNTSALPAFAKSIHFNKTQTTHYGIYHSARFLRSHRWHVGAYGGHSYGGHVIQCVAFAKQDAGIQISGNARDWWYNAEGVYKRGHAPEYGSVLAFQANGRMPLGHVAVVSGVVDSRTITIDQSHWGRSGISRDIAVVDVSQNNDWSAVRVQLGRGGEYGSIYPTHGFIYPRADDGRIVQAAARAPMPDIGPAPADLRGSHARHAVTEVEMAEVPTVHRGLDLSLNGIGSDSPDRGIQ